MKEAFVSYSEPASPFWFKGKQNCIPRRVDREATFNFIDDGDGSGLFLIECSDGSVFTTDDIYGSRNR